MIETDRLLELIDQFAEAEGRMKWAPNKKLHFEVAVIKAIQSLSQVTFNEVIENLNALRDGKRFLRKRPRPQPATPRPNPLCPASGLPKSTPPPAGAPGKKTTSARVAEKRLNRRHRQVTQQQSGARCVRKFRHADFSGPSWIH